MKTCPCVLTGTLTSPDKINGASRESISTVNKAQLTATGNGLLLKFNSETPDLLQDGVYTPNQRHRRLSWKPSGWRGVSILTELRHLPVESSWNWCNDLYDNLLPQLERVHCTGPEVLLALTHFAVDLQVCTNGCHLCYKLPQFVTLQKNSQMSGWLLPQGCKAYKEFPAFPAACNYSRSDKVTWYRPRGQLLCRVCVGDRNPHLCLLLNYMKLHRLSAVLYTSHLNETNECYSLPPYTVAAGTGCVFHFLTWTPFNAFLHLVLKYSLPSLGKTET